MNRNRIGQSAESHLVGQSDADASRGHDELVVGLQFVALVFLQHHGACELSTHLLESLEVCGGGFGGGGGGQA